MIEQEKPSATQLVRVDGESYVVISTDDTHLYLAKIEGPIKHVMKRCVKQNPDNKRLFYYDGQ